VTVAGGQSVATDAQGRFQLGADTRPPETPMPVTVEASGHLRRQTFLKWERGERETVIDLIPDGRPFSPDFFRELLHDAYDSPGAPESFERWTSTPKLYLRTIDQQGRAVEPEVLAVIRHAVGWSVPAFTGGLMSAVLEEGTETPPLANGMIRILVIRDDPSSTVCGRATVGLDPGNITLFSDACSCGSVKVPPELVAHEVGHALGFWHVSDPRSIMYPTIKSQCPSGALSADERYHSALGYRRSPGHVEPDTDTNVTPLSARRRLEIEN
jgi:hypothetical protein